MSAPRTSSPSRTGRGQVSAACESSSTAVEVLLSIGKHARMLARRGASIAELAERLGVRPRLVLLGILLLTSPDTLKLRALVEDWTLMKTLAVMRREIVH